VRPRKLLLQRRQIRKLIGATQEKGLTLVPLDLYLRDGLVKLTFAMGRGKKLYDKRQDEKRRESQREIERAVRSSS
jgi:SsrA-binding protein